MGSWRNYENLTNLIRCGGNYDRNHDTMIGKSGDKDPGHPGDLKQFFSGEGSSRSTVVVSS